MTNLKYLKISLPAAYEEGKITAYAWKSISDILSDGFPGEIECLREWCKENLVSACGWKDMTDVQTEDEIKEILTLLEAMKAKLVNCIYEETNDTDESA